MAKETIVQKFTNTRNSWKRNSHGENRVSERELHDAMVSAANALVDLKSFSKGKSLFRKKNENEIIEKRNVLVNSPINMSPIGAYQKALRILWSEADQDKWEAKAAGELEDIYVYVCLTSIYFILYILTRHDFRNQKVFGEHLYNSLRSLCQVGGLGRLQVLVSYVYRNDFGQIESGL